MAMGMKSTNFLWVVILKNKIVKMAGFVTSSKFTYLENLYIILYGIFHANTINILKAYSKPNDPLYML